MVPSVTPNSLPSTVSALLCKEDVVMANSVSRYQPQTSLTRLPDLVDRLFRESFVAPTFFDRSFGGSNRPVLPVNLFETPESYVMHLALPGMKPENLDIQVAGREVS